MAYFDCPGIWNIRDQKPTNCKKSSVPLPSANAALNDLMVIFYGLQMTTAVKYGKHLLCRNNADETEGALALSLFF
jgi:hypothetical protein